MTEQTTAALATLHADTRGCHACRLCENRQQVVNGIGPPKAEIMFTGEGPGAFENRLGEPFTGESGQLLDRIIAAMKLKRGHVFLSNVVRCYVAEDDRIRKAEIEACRGFLEREIEAVSPRIIVPLGAIAWRWFVPGDKRAMRDVRGGTYRWRGTTVMPTYHPAFLLRRREFKRDVWMDMQRVVHTLQQLRDNIPVGALDVEAEITKSQAKNPKVREFANQTSLLAALGDKMEGDHKRRSDR